MFQSQACLLSEQIILVIMIISMRTLKEWLKWTDSPPTWHEFAQAVEPFDPYKADEIKQCYCVGEERCEEGMNHCV